MRILPCVLFGLAWILCGCEQAQWVKVQPADGRFSILMPGQPPEHRNLAQLPLGPVRVSDYTLTTNTITYSVA